MKNLEKFRFIVLAMAILFTSGSLQAQKYFTRDGSITFFSTTPVEDIEAINSKVSAVLDSESGAVEFAALMNAFEFKKALMEEHFNENYVESEKFPKAIFKGKIENIKSINFSKDGSYKAVVNGELSLHGVTKTVSVEGNIEVKDGNLILTCEFEVKPEDYEIEIPGVVRDKIAEDIEVSVEAKLAPFNR